MTKVLGDGFEIVLIPATLAATTLCDLQSGDTVNLEVDILAKYVASLMGKPGVDAAEG